MLLLPLLLPLNLPLLLLLLPLLLPALLLLISGSMWDEKRAALPPTEALLPLSSKLR